METSLRLGYDFLSPPGSSHSLLGFKGYDIDAFRDFARVIGRRLEFVQLKSTATIPHDQERSPFTGVPGAIENGTIFSFLDQNALTPIRVHSFKYILNQMLVFDLYGGRLSGVSEATSLYRFIVFTPTALVLVIATMIFLRLPVLKFGSSTRFIANFFLLYGVLLIFFFHGAGFQGNTSFPPPIPARNLEYYLSGLRSGVVGLIAGLSTTRYFLLRDPSRLFVIADPSEVSLLLCSPTKKYIAALASTQFFQLPKPRSGCVLGKVDPSVLVDGKLQKFGLFTEKMAVFLLPIETPKKWMKQLKWMYNTFYNIENASSPFQSLRLGILHRRYSNGRSSDPERVADSSLPTYSPFTLIRLSSVIYSFLALILLSIVVFIVELLFPIAKAMRLVRKLRNLRF